MKIVSPVVHFLITMMCWWRERMRFPLRHTIYSLTNRCPNMEDMGWYFVDDTATRHCQYCFTMFQVDAVRHVWVRAFVLRRINWYTMMYWLTFLLSNDDGCNEELLCGVSFSSIIVASCYALFPHGLHHGLLPFHLPYCCHHHHVLHSWERWRLGPWEVCS